MNHDLPPFDDPAHEREWQAQERAREAERHGLDPAADDARMRGYRLLAHALRQPMPAALPADFAQRMAAQVANASPRRPAADARLDAALLLGLAAAMSVAAGVVVVNYGDAWLPAFRNLLPAANASGWLLALGACLGGSWLLGLWQRHSHGQAA